MPASVLEAPAAFCVQAFQVPSFGNPIKSCKIELNAQMERRKLTPGGRSGIVALPMPACLRHLQRPMPAADPVTMLRVPTRQRPRAHRLPGPDHRNFRGYPGGH